MRTVGGSLECVECVQAGAQGIQQPQTLQPQLQPDTQFGGRQRSGVPLITYALIAANVVVFVLQSVSHAGPGGLERQLALWPPAVAAGQLYRLVTSAFVHYGPIHLLFNMWALYVVGPSLEAWLGRLRFAALYALSGLGGSVLAYLLAPLNSATAGASGAVFGLFAATFVLARRLQLDVRGVVALIAINLGFTVFAHNVISWQGHVGGLVTGGLISAAYVYAPRQGRNLIQATVTFAALAVFAALIWWRTGQIIAELTT